MNTLQTLSNDPGLLITAIVVILFALGIFYAVYDSLSSLDQFRDNLTVGTIVKVKNGTQVFRARIVARYDKTSFTVKEIDTREITHSPTKHIYKP